MIDHQASRTAEYMALFRALESARPAGKRLFDDPYARTFLSPPLSLAAALARLPALGAAIPWLIDRRWPGARPSGVARTRLIDDLLAQALDTGIGQVVILGSGFDCRAYRLPQLRSVCVFEVDHPDTLRAKRARLSAILAGPVSRVVYAEIDFNRQDVASGLIEAGFDPARRTFFIWEGVTNYLTADAVDAMLRFIADCAPGSRLMFTYVHRAALDGSAEFPGMVALARTLRRAGETWTFGLNPAELPGYLLARGLRLLEDIGSVEYRARYLGPRGHHLVGYEFYRAALAEVVDHRAANYSIV